jgi:two-component system sensor histidine kinase BaeS
MRLGLRWKILTFTVLPIVALTVAALWTVNRNISRQVYANIHEDLRRSSAVLENILTARGRELAVAGQVIVQDPKFFSVLTIPAGHDDAQLRATVAGVARDFNSITQSDLFEVIDARGNLIASVGRDESTPSSRADLVGRALTARATSGILVHPAGHYQATVTPVTAGGRIIGALLLGQRTGHDLAEGLRSLTRSDVTFISGATIAASTLEDNGDRDALLRAVGNLDVHAGQDAERPQVLQVVAPRHRYLTLVREMPLSTADQRQSYIMQRSVDVETSFLREIQNQLVALGVIMILAALVAGIFIAQRITSPVQRLVRGAEEMERGNYDYPLGVTGADEIGYLASRFQEMRQSQRDYVQNLHDMARLKHDFISVASHELRTPISVIQGFQELLLGGVLGDQNPQQVRALEAIGRSIGTLRRIADDATRMAHIESDRLALTRQDHALDELVRQAVQSAQSAGEGRQVEMRTEIAPSIGMVFVDGGRLVEAIQNLLTNAIRFTPDGGRVRVGAHVEEGTLVIAIEDSGVGIHPDRLPHVFDRSFMVRNALHHHSSSRLEFNSAGLGLGLSIARGIVEAHGGAITVKSERGQGSTFTMRIPLEQPASVEAVA